MSDAAAAAPQDTRLVATLRLIRAWWPVEATEALRLAITSVVAVYLCMLLLLQTPQWAGWTVISVALANRAMSLQKSIWRALGSIVGAIISLAMVAAFAQATLAFDVALAALLGFCAFMSTLQRGFRTYGFALIGYTVPIIVLSQVQHPEHVFDVAVDRVSTTLVGLGCSYASATLVARGVRTVRRILADKLDAAMRTTRAWLDKARRGDLAERPPLDEVLALDAAIFDGFTEQPSLQTGGGLVRDAPVTLLHLLTIGMLRARLPTPDGSDARPVDARALLGASFVTDQGEWDRLATAKDQLLDLRRPNFKRVPAKPLPLDLDYVQAGKNALRAIVAVSITNAFWYVSNWPPGSGMVTWAGLACVLYATTPDNAGVTRNFMVGAIMAAVLGVMAQYAVLAQSFDTWQLATVLLPLMILAQLGHGEKGAAFGGGFSFLILTFVDPQNVMTYDLTASLNDALADILGLGTAVICFTYLLPAASPHTRAIRARGRMIKDVRMLAGQPARFLPTRHDWLARMCQRLAKVGAAPEAVAGAEALLVAGALLFALRRDDDRLGRAAAAALWDAADPHAALARLAATAGDLDRDRLTTISAILRPGVFEGWRGAPPGLQGAHP